MIKAEAKDLIATLDNKNVTLVAVSKTKPVSLIKEGYDLGLRDFGENRVQELVDKIDHLPSDVRWHMIGNLQKNKVKYIASFVHLIHSVSSESLIKAVNKEGRKNDRVINILLQVKIAEEETKSGLKKEEAHTLIHNYLKGEYPNVLILGFMGMASFTADDDQVRREFQGLKAYADYMNALHPELFKDVDPILSMGMSGDYNIAIEEGSNMVRIGSLVFGAR